MVNIYYWTQCNTQEFLYLCVKNILDTAKQTDWVFFLSGNSYKQARIKKKNSFRFKVSNITFLEE